MNISDFELENYKKYSGEVYHAETITRLPPRDSKVYTDKLLWTRINLVEQYSQHGKILDLCCGTGQHLIHLAKNIQEGKGLDFSSAFITQANQYKTMANVDNLEFFEGNARKMPFDDNYFDMVYSFSSLYTIPKVEEVICEIARVLKPGGRTLLDLGNLNSLNALVCRATPNIANTYHIPVSQMRRFIGDAGLIINCHRSFQILPMWGAHPAFWMQPLLWQGWTKVLAVEFCGKMLDEWISSLPGLRKFAFRHVFICQKT